MILQDLTWGIALAGIILVALVFLYFISQAGKPAGKAFTRKADPLRRWMFGGLAVVFVGGTYGTLRHFPIPAQQRPLGIDQVVDIVSRQWAWQIEPGKVQAGRPVEFRVTSADVNHSFAVYAPNGRIVTQTQAMPGYSNKIVYTFTEPGTYRVMCLEYCGLGHAVMTAKFEVVEGAGS